MSTPLERAAEAVYQRYDQVNTLTAPNIARAALAAAIDEGEIADIIHERFNECRGRQGVSPALLATAIKAYLLGGAE